MIMKKKSIFFSTSTRFLNDNKARYSKIIQDTKDLGITITNNWLQHDKGALSEADFEKIKRSILISDGVVFEATIPSTSIGYQVSYAIENKKPCLLLIYNEENECKAYAERHSLNYVDENYLSIKTYQDDNLKSVLEGFIKRYVDTRVNTRFNFVIPRYMNNYLEAQALINKMSKTVYLKNLIKTDMQSNGESN